MQLDMTNVFLNAPIDRPHYMKQPKYYDDGSGRVCLLKKSPKLWYEEYDGFLQSGGWSKSQVDEAFYFHEVKHNDKCYMLVYVDDLLAANRSKAHLAELKTVRENAFKL
ncbi:hypothetical protein CLOP_g21355 [Closterium sp. NIES-67]|nr:hypothetical protein CLOP_g21355 [Closterium sp. NIES-67]